mmetsp:Transcript_14851/g.49767  ORF Transcript_14851/g.49767 Transcript_14851/m.49767 type:complete len:234 (+) Transcript_14851:612-1313(+)
MARFRVRGDDVHQHLGVKVHNRVQRYLRRDGVKHGRRGNAGDGVGPDEVGDALRLERRHLLHGFRRHGFEELRRCHSRLCVRPGHVGQVVRVALAHQIGCLENAVGNTVEKILRPLDVPDARNPPDDRREAARVEGVDSRGGKGGQLGHARVDDFFGAFRWPRKLEDLCDAMDRRRRIDRAKLGMARLEDVQDGLHALRGGEGLVQGCLLNVVVRVCRPVVGLLGQCAVSLAR